ncbi:MAG: uridylate kinase [Planctomycetes bacterium]|nr:uridylate kinase [Planctomycetota bacterium]
MTVGQIETSAVVKLGGSLLDLPDLALRLTNFLSEFDRLRTVTICGGGPTVDLIRTWDRQLNLGEEASHWIALQARTVNAQVVARVVECVEYTSRIEDFTEIWSRGHVPVYDALTFIREIDEHSVAPLPRRWRVTSDSIAARLAIHLKAPELVLLKSTTLPENLTLKRAAQEGFVDPHFPVAGREVPRVVSVNLRSAEPEERTLTPEQSS